MKRFFVLASLTLMTAGLSLAGEYTGYVTDAKCAKAGKAGPDHAGCAKGCIGGGAETVLVDADGKIMTIAEQDKVKEFAGDKVTITGSETDGKISVESIAKAG